MVYIVLGTELGMRTIASCLLVVAVASPCLAGEVEIVRAAFRALGQNGDRGAWRVEVTLRHDDTGWEHYADAWRVVLEDGTVLGTRTLYHPHETEQPFTRGHDVIVPATARTVHGWAAERLAVDLERSAGARFEVSR